MLAEFREPWAFAWLGDSNRALITEKRGALKLWQQGQPQQSIQGIPAVDYGGDGGLGDVVTSPDFGTTGLIYLSWVEAGNADIRGAVVGRGRLVLDAVPRIEGLEVIWRQTPKVGGHGHYSHRLAFAPDGRSLYISSGDRRLMTPAQDPRSDLGKIIRVPLGPTPTNAVGLPQQVSLGHRNVLGLKFDSQGWLWGLEHGPAGGDELNLVKPGNNYGWPKVSEGDHYDGSKIPRHRTRPKFSAPAISWNPVIAPGDFLFYSGAMFPEWRGQAIIAGLRTQALIRVAIKGETAQELARHPMQNRVRSVAEDRDGALLILEDGPHGRLLRLARPERK